VGEPPRNQWRCPPDGGHFRPYVRPIGQQDPGSESVASSAVGRHEDRRAKYARGLVAYLAGSPPVTEVLTAGLRQGEHALTA
jgi:hypothetical protein